jgi:uncharacterized protein
LTLIHVGVERGSDQLREGTHGQSIRRVRFHAQRAGSAGSNGQQASLRPERGRVGARHVGPQEINFIAQRDSFYLASVSETGWRYVQHRGGPAGFLKVLSPTTLGFADFRGNRQYVSVGNFLKNDRVALILMDYPNQSRLKILGHARVLAETETEHLERLKLPAYRARAERGFLIEVAAYDWNCLQHITPRYTQQEVEIAVAPLKRRLKTLEHELKLPQQKSGESTHEP